MPFFETFQGNGKAVINISAFERWIREIRNIEALNPEQTFEEGSSQISTIGDDPFFSDNETFNGDAPRDLSEKHDAYLYGAT